MLVQMTRYFEVSKALPSPSKSPHQACKLAFPVRAWQITRTLSRRSFSFPYVWYRNCATGKISWFSKTKSFLMNESPSAVILPYSSFISSLLKERRLILEEWELVEAAYDQEARPEDNENLLGEENCFNSRRDNLLPIVADMVDLDCDLDCDCDCLQQGEVSGRCTWLRLRLIKNR